jgi:hypothetical protein
VEEASSGLDDGVVVAAGVPEEDLAGRGTAEDEVGLEGGEDDGEDVGLHERQEGGEWLERGGVNDSDDQSYHKCREGYTRKRKPHTSMEDRPGSIGPMDIPNAYQAIRFLDGSQIFAVRGGDQLGRLPRQSATNVEMLRELFLTAPERLYCKWTRITYLRLKTSLDP